MLPVATNFQLCGERYPVFPFSSKTRQKRLFYNLLTRPVLVRKFFVATLWSIAAERESLLYLSASNEKRTFCTGRNVRIKLIEKVAMRRKQVHVFFYSVVDGVTQHNLSLDKDERT